MKQNALLECTACGRKLQRKIWTNITFGHAKKVEAKLFDRKINYFSCDRCGSKGFACYPIRINHLQSGKEALIIPCEDELFEVIEVGDENPCRIFYDFDNLNMTLYRWQGGSINLFEPPPDEADIEESLRKNIINKEEAEILRNTDWDALNYYMNEESMEIRVDEKGNIMFDCNKDFDRAIDLFERFMPELEQSRKVVQFKK